MCEVVRTNFEALYPQIEEVIKYSDFVAIDTEFTGLASNDSIKPSLFDDPEARYKKVKKSASQFIICQFGLSAFVKDRAASTKNKSIMSAKSKRYVAHVYNFFIFPHCFGPVDSRFLVQASSLEFLCQHKFDFNKFIYEGIPYLNKDQEAILRKHHEEQNMYLGVESSRLRQIDQQVVNINCSRVEEWLATAQGGDHTILECQSNVAQYLVLTQLKRQFPSIHCKVGESFRIIVTKSVAENERLQEAVSSDCTEEEKSFSCAFCLVCAGSLNVSSDFISVGFSRVVQLLASHKKPIIGHNMFTDLLLMYDKFCQPLPGSYAEFKREIHDLFPSVYDTKHIAFRIRKLEALKNCADFLKETNLEELFTTLNSEKAIFFVLHNPDINFSDNCKHYATTGFPHEAGYDAYQAGCVFIRMAHLLACKSCRVEPGGPLPFQRYLKVLQPNKNKVNISRADVSFMNLSGDDPTSVRPQWLHVTAVKRSMTLHAPDLVQEFARFGSLDVKILDSKHAIVAVTSHYRARDVLRAFAKSKKYRVRLYNSFLDSPRIQSVLWVGGVLAVVSLWLGVTAAVLRTNN